nr:hypothetical protein [Tanacetum cinerariifolium]
MSLKSLCSSSGTQSRRKIPDIYPRVKGEEFTPVKDDDDTLTFLTGLGYKEPEAEPAKKRTASRRVVKKKVTISIDDNIIPDPDVALELGKSISIIKAEEEEAARKVHATHARIVTESIPEPAKKRLPVENKKLQMLCKLSKKARKLVEDSQVLEAQVKELVGYQGFLMSPQSYLLPQVKELEDDEKKDDTDEEKSINIEMTDDEEIDDEVLQESVNSDEEDIDAAKVDAEKTEEAKDVQETPSTAPVTTLPPLFVTTIPSAPLQQSTTPIPSPPTTTDAPTITTAIPKTDALSVVQLRVAKLVKDVSELKKIDHSTKSLDTLKSQVLTVVEQYLGSKISDDPQKTMHENMSFNRNPANHRLYHALMEALIEDENGIDKGVANTVKDHKRKHDDDEDPPAGPNQ